MLINLRFSRLSFDVRSGVLIGNLLLFRGGHHLIGSCRVSMSHISKRFEEMLHTPIPSELIENYKLNKQAWNFLDIIYKTTLKEDVSMEVSF
jgi:hypothetical protein